MSHITVRYFAAAAEAAGCEEEALDLRPAADDAAPTLAALRLHLEERYGAPMAKVLRSGSFLVDGVVRRDDGVIADAGSPIRVDVLPPFAGG